MSPSYGHPGIYVTEQLSGPTPPALQISPSTAAFAGEHWKGPSYAVQCTSWNQFVTFFGGFNPSATPTLANPYLPYAVYEFFANGGQACWVYRIPCSVTPGSTASVNLKDKAATPQNTLSLTAGLLGVAGNIGTWGNGLYCDVVVNTSGTGRFNINVYLGGSTPQYLVEQWVDLSMVKTDPRYVVSILNSPSQGSLYVVATDLADPTAAPNNAPAAVTGVQFSGGLDASDPSTSDYQTAFTYGTSTPGAFDNVSGVLNINIPGMSTAAVLNTAILYAQNRPTSFLVIDPPAAQTPAGVASFFASLSPVSASAAVYYPWVTATNPATANLQSTILLPPGGFVLGQMVATDSTAGVWTAPAGTTTALANVVKAERLFTSNDLDTLTATNVNPLKTQPSGQVMIWGTRTMQQGFATLYVPIRRTLNYIEGALTQLLQFVIFEPNDVLLWSNITAVCNSFLDGLWGQNAFPGSTSSQAYFVTCNSTNNTAQSIAQGIVNTTVGVALAYPAEFINLVISQFQAGGTTTVSAIA